MHCPKCDADVSETYQAAEWDCGIQAGYYCDACDLGIPEDEYQPLEGDVQISGSYKIDVSKLGTPLKDLSTRPGPKNDPNHPDHARYAEWVRICESYGYD